MYFYNEERIGYRRGRERGREGATWIYKQLPILSPILDLDRPRAENKKDNVERSRFFSQDLISDSPSTEKEKLYPARSEISRSVNFDSKSGLLRFFYEIPTWR